MKKVKDLNVTEEEQEEPELTVKEWHEEEARVGLL